MEFGLTKPRGHGIARVGTPKERIVLKGYPLDNSDPDVQIDTTLSEGNANLVKEYKKISDYYKPFVNLPNKGWFVDHVDGDKNPYYGVDLKDGKLVNGRIAKIGSTPPPTNAVMIDMPVMGGSSGEGYRPQTMMFETCAICIDNKKVLGCLKWGFKVAEAMGSKAEILQGKEGDVSNTASDDFKDAVKRWDAVAKKNEGWVTVGDLK